MALSRAEIRQRWKAAHPDYKPPVREPSITCVDCGEWSVHEAHGKCRRCYKREQSQRPQSRAVNNARSAAWNEAHREETREYFAARIREDAEWAEKRRAHWRSVVARDPEANRAKVKAWRHENPAKRQAQGNLRRARKLAIPSTLTAAEWIAILAQFGNRCVYCGGDGPMTMDHAVPLSRGGHHIAANVVPACRLCNSAKGALTAEEFRARRR